MATIRVHRGKRYVQLGIYQSRNIEGRDSMVAKERILEAFGQLI